MTFFLFAKWWKFIKKKKLSYIINIYFKISNFLDKVYNDLKDFQINLLLEFFMCLILELLKLF
jgi:hypothetical protein